MLTTEMWSRLHKKIWEAVLHPSSGHIIVFTEQWINLAVGVWSEYFYLNLIGTTRTLWCKSGEKPCFQSCVHGSGAKTSSHASTGLEICEILIENQTRGVPLFANERNRFYFLFLCIYCLYGINLIAEYSNEEYTEPIKRDVRWLQKSNLSFVLYVIGKLWEKRKIADSKQ